MKPVILLRALNRLLSRVNRWLASRLDRHIQRDDMAKFKGFVDHDVKNSCPYCRKVMDGATGITSEAEPDEGDVSICFYCAKVSVFTAEGRLVEPTEEQAATFAEDDVITEAKAALEDYLDRNPEIDRGML